MKRLNSRLLNLVDGDSAFPRGCSPIELASAYTMLNTSVYSLTKKGVFTSNGWTAPSKVCSGEWAHRCWPSGQAACRRVLAFMIMRGC